MRKIDLIVIYYFATREGHCLMEYNPDTCHCRRGFNGPDYHFYIRKDKRIVNTRPIERVGAHACGLDARSADICYEGGLDHEEHLKDTRTPEQKHSMRVLTCTLLADYPGCEVCRHRDLSTDLDGNGGIEPGEWIKACLYFGISLWEVFG